MKRWLVLGLLSLSGAAFAASAPTSSAKTPTAATKTVAFIPASTLTTSITPAVPETAPSSWSGGVTLARSNSLYTEDGDSATASWDFTSTLAYKMNSVLSVSAFLDGSQDLKKPETSDFGRGNIGLSYHKDSKVQPLVDFTPSVKIGFPVSRAASSDSMKAALTVGTKATIGSDHLYFKKMSIDFSFGGTRYIHQYTTNAKGLLNNQYGLSEVMTLGWNFTDDLSISYALTHLNYWNYEGTMKEYFNHTEELGYKLTQNWAVALGHSYGNPYTNVWNADNQTYNTNLTDEQNSVVYGQVGYTF